MTLELLAAAPLSTNSLIVRQANLHLPPDTYSLAATYNRLALFNHSRFFTPANYMRWDVHCCLNAFSYNKISTTTRYHK